MCFTGACYYENYGGECRLPLFSARPDDAACVRWEREATQENEEQQEEQEEED